MAGQNNRQVAPAAPKPPPQLSEETLKDLLDVQSKELALRSKEMDLRLRELDNNTAHAEKILQAQERDREQERKHFTAATIHKLIFALLVLLVVVGFAAFGLYLNKDAIVKDVLQIGLSAVVGALGGYGYAKQQKAAQSSADEG